MYNPWLLFSSQLLAGQAAAKQHLEGARALTGGRGDLAAKSSSSAKSRNAKVPGQQLLAPALQVNKQYACSEGR